MDNLNYFDLSHLSITQWVILGVFAFAALFLLVKAAIVIQNYEGNNDSQKKLHDSIVVGLLGGSFWFFCMMAIFIVLWSNLGIRIAAFYAISLGVCTVPLIFLISVVGSYVQLSWTDKLKGVQNTIGEQEIRRKRK